jgi:hypothetical protein
MEANGIEMRFTEARREQSTNLARFFECFHQIPKGSRIEGNASIYGNKGSRIEGNASIYGNKGRVFIRYR